MLKWTLALTLASAAYLPAEAGQSRNCADRARVLDMLDTGYGENRLSIGLGANNTVMEVFVSPETGTWTITETSTEGRTCILASGQSFESTLKDLAAVKGEAL